MLLAASATLKIYGSFFSLIAFLNDLAKVLLFDWPLNLRSILYHASLWVDLFVNMAFSASEPMIGELEAMNVTILWEADNESFDKSLTYSSSSLSVSNPNFCLAPI